MDRDLVQYIIEAGNDFFDTLPDPSDVDDEYDPRDDIESFVSSEVKTIERMLWDHCQSVAQDWIDQQGEN